MSKSIINSYEVRVNRETRQTYLCDSSKRVLAPEQITKSDYVQHVLESFFEVSTLAEEHFYTLALDNSLHLIAVFDTSHGSVNAAYISPREIFNRLLMSGAGMFMVAHNHPSGSMTPSAEDIAFAERLFKAGELLDIPLVDSIIIADTNSFSFRQNYISPFKPVKRKGGKRTS